MHRSCMKIDLHGLNDRDRWPLSMDATSMCYFSPIRWKGKEKKKTDETFCCKKKKKKRVSKLIDRSKIARVLISLIFPKRKKKKKNGLNNGMNKLLHLSSSIDRRGNKLRGKKN